MQAPGISIDLLGNLHNRFVRMGENRRWNSKENFTIQLSGVISVRRSIGTIIWQVLNTCYLSRWCSRKAIEIARQLNRDASMVSRLCASYTIWRREYIARE